MSNYENINRLFEELKNLPDEPGKRICLAIQESFIFLERNEQKEIAEKIYKWAGEHASEKPLIYSYSKLIFAFSLYYSEHYDEALPILTEAQNLFYDLKDPNGAAVCILLQGSTYRTFGNVDLALNALWSVYEQLKNAQDFLHFFLACNVQMGGIYFEMKHYEESVSHFKSSLELSEKSGKFYWEIYALHGLAKVYLVQQKFPEAKECLEKAKLVAEKNHHPLSLGNSLSELGNYYLATGNLPEAEEFYKQSLSVREKYNFIGGAITSCIRLGEIYIKDSKPLEAEACLEKGLKLAEEIKVKPKMYQIHLLLSGISEKNNDPGKSLHHYKLFSALREQVEIEDTARKIKNLKLVFEAEQTKKENLIIKKQKAEIEKKNIELQETIDKLTLARVGKKARLITMIIAIILFILDDFILAFVLKLLPKDNYMISLAVKMIIIFSLNPINKVIQLYLLRRIIKKRKNEVLV